VSPSVPGTVIDHIPAAGQCYIGSPSIAILPGGAYVASHDIFGPGSTSDVTRLFRSDDRGMTWRPIGEIEGQFWSNLFLHRGALFIMGTTRRFGGVCIRRSEDEGKSWTSPMDDRRGLLFADGQYHTAPMPVVEHRGRLWRAMEDLKPGSPRRRDFRAFVLSAPADADLLLAENWIASERLDSDPALLDGNFAHWLEGNAVVAPDGEIVDVLRADYRVGDREVAAIVHIGEDGRAARFDSDRDFVTFPGGCKKFSIRHDAAGGLYWTLSNAIPDEFRGHNVERTRNTLALMSSPDLRNWTIRRIVLQHPSVEDHGFQYVDWRFEGEDIVVVSRTAFDDGQGGAHNQHDANYMTFHRVEHFRSS
jgi:hypothetical protein